MATLHRYLPQDRLRALARGATWDTETRHSELITAGLDELLRGGRPSNLVNPEVLEGR